MSNGLGVNVSRDEAVRELGFLCHGGLSGEEQHPREGMISAAQCQPCLLTALPSSALLVSGAEMVASVQLYCVCLWKQNLLLR